MRSSSLLDEFNVVLTPPPQFQADRAHSATAALKTFSSALEPGATAGHYATLLGTRAPHSSTNDAVRATGGQHGFLFNRLPGPAVPSSTNYEIGNAMGKSWKHVEDSAALDEDSGGTTAADFYKRMERMEKDRAMGETEYKLDSTLAIEKQLAKAKAQRSDNDASRLFRAPLLTACRQLHGSKPIARCASMRTDTRDLTSHRGCLTPLSCRRGCLDQGKDS
jgi:hypothetical protein